MLYFRDRKFKSEIDASFSIKDGMYYETMENYYIGESIMLIFDISPEIACIINDMDSFGGSSCMGVMIMELTENELQLLKDSLHNNNKWNEAVKRIRSVRNGCHPPDWGEKVIFGILQDAGLGVKTVTIKQTHTPI